jgi:hypothetical protein
MRVMVKVHFNVAASNRAIKDGSLPKMIQGFIQKYKPEASYFLPENGTRTAYFFLDMKDAAQLPPLLEGWWSAAEASVSVTPAMNAEDLAQGLQQLG